METIAVLLIDNYYNYCYMCHLAHADQTAEPPQEQTNMSKANNSSISSPAD